MSSGLAASFRVDVLGSSGQGKGVLPLFLNRQKQIKGQCNYHGSFKYF